jgi:hypothetical protein
MNVQMLVIASLLAIACVPQMNAQTTSPATKPGTARDYYTELGKARNLNTTWGDAYACFGEEPDDKTFFIFEAEFRDFDERGKGVWSFGPSNFKKNSNPADDDDTQLLVEVTVYQKGVLQDIYLGERQNTSDDVVRFTFTMKEVQDWFVLSLAPGTWRYHLEMAGRYVGWFGRTSLAKKVDAYGQCELIPEKWHKREVK